MYLKNKKAIVVGSGIVGVSTAWNLVKQGIEHVTLIDSHKIPRENGAASIDGSRSIRYTYGTEIGYMLMVKDAYEVWDELFEDLGEKLYTPTGTLLLQNTNVNYNNEKNKSYSNLNIESYESMSKYKDRLGIDVKYLTANEIKQKFPYFNSDGIEFGIWTSSGGILHADSIVLKTVEWLKKCPNVTILDGFEYEVIKVTPFNEIQEKADEDNQHICVLKSGKVLKSDIIVLAVNCFTNDLLPKVKAEGKLTYCRSEATYFEVPEVDKSIWQSLPVTREMKGDFYTSLYPYVGGPRCIGIKSTINPIDTDTDIHTDDFLPNENFSQPCIDFINNRLKTKTENPIIPKKIKVCYFDMYHNKQFQFHSFDPTDTCIALFGFSSHGFKFGALVGKATSYFLSKRISYENTKNWLAGRTTLAFSEVS